MRFFYFIYSFRNQVKYMDFIDEINPSEVELLLNSNKNLDIIDVREDEEVALGMIEGAIHIPLTQIPYKLDELSKGKHYIIVCRSGARSHMTASYLKKHGFKVSNMTEGMLGWKGEVII